MCGPSNVSAMETDRPDDLSSVTLIVIDGRKDGVCLHLKPTVWSECGHPRRRKGLRVSPDNSHSLDLCRASVSSSQRSTPPVRETESICIRFCLRIHLFDILSVPLPLWHEP